MRRSLIHGWMCRVMWWRGPGKGASWLAGRAMHGVAAITCVVALNGCEGDELNEAELTEIHKVFKTGASFESDPYVRAETLRVLELLADERLTQYAVPQLEDGSDMVRVAALRVLLATRHPEAEREALSLYTRAESNTREAVLNAAEQYGPESLLQELYAQAMRSKESRLRMRAFEKGMLERFDEADESRRKMELIPELSKLVSEGDTDVAARALKKLVEVGREDRAEPLLLVLQDKEAPIEKRLEAAKTLRLAQYQPAHEAFHAIGVEPLKEFLAQIGETLDEEEQEDGGDGKKRRGKRRRLQLPLEKTDKRLIRQAVLGAVALGDERYLRMAKSYVESASQEETLEVLEAISHHPSEDARLALKIAMQDARPEVRYAAIELYGAREDAAAKALINALRQKDPLARKMLATLLVERFPKAWSEELIFQLGAPETRKVALQLLRDVISPEREDNREILKYLKDTLASLVKSGDTKQDEEMISTAAYLLLLTDAQSAAYQKLVEEQSGIKTRYVFMEQMVQRDPARHIPLFRRYFYDDLFALRLMSAAGLWNAFKHSPALNGEKVSGSREEAPAVKEKAAPKEAERGEREEDEEA